MSPFEKWKARKDAIRNQAREAYADPSDDNVEVDDDAKVTKVLENDGKVKGYWVQAWVWVDVNDVVPTKEAANG